MSDNKYLHVLIIDDDDMMRSYLRIMLRAASIENIEEIGTFEKAIKLLSLRKYDLIFLDINLPDADGISSIPIIKNKLPDCEIIMISGESTMDRVKQAMSAGAKDFIAKPFNANSVETKIKQLVNEVK